MNASCRWLAIVALAMVAFYATASFADDLNLREIATASSIYSPSHRAEYATDGDRSTRWCSSTPYGKREWLQIDLGRVQPIGRVEILWEVAYAKGYQLSASDNAKDWKILHKTPHGDGGRDVLNDLNAKVRYLRLDCLERGTEHGFSLYEFSVFADATTSPDLLKDVVPADFTYVPAVEMPRHIELSINRRYLNIPLVDDGKGAKRNITIRIDNELLGEFGATLAVDKPDYYGFLDLTHYQGKTLTIDIDRFPGEPDQITLDDQIKGSENLYREAYRPQFHFTSRRGWLNDPNGLIYYKGQYHMYYQHNPLGTHWGNMTWGHAVSDDLVHWKEQPRVLFPNPETGACFSGAAFIDQRNQLGRKTGDEDLLVAFYLRTKIGLCLAYSNDRGQTMTDYETNPVLTHEGARIDTPRPFWYEPTGRWVAPTYDFFTDEHGKKLRAVGFYSSENLTDWKFESRVEQDKWGDELCGCVDFFQLPVDGNPLDMKWVMVFIDGSYIVGTFDGHTFRTLAGKPAVTDDRIRSLVIQGHYYATMTWHNMPKDRRVQITWMRGPTHPGMPFNQQMTLPSELTLRSTAAGPRLRMNPIEELDVLRTKTHQWNDVALKEGENPLADLKGELFDLEVEFEPAAGATTVFSLRGIKVTYDCDSQMLTCGDEGPVSTKLEPVDGVIRLRILLDRSSFEVYGNDGRVYIPLIIFPERGNHSFSATCTQGAVKTNYLRVHELTSAWE